jgi:autotransporter translocation and assembly factor TamB
LSVTGTIGLDNLQPSTLDMTADLHDFWLSGTEDMRLAISTEASSPIRVTSTYPAVNVRGGIRLTEGNIILAESFWTAGGGLALDDRIHVIRRATDGPVERVRQEEEVSELMQNLDLRLDLDLSNQLNINVEMPLSQDYGQQLAALSSLFASAELTGELQAGYLNNNLSLAGEVEFIQGELSWLGRDFTMDDGSILKFTGREYSNPYLALQARYMTSSYGDVVMGVEGPAFEPSLSFSSENAVQEYDQTDLFAILLTGKPASAMADSEGETNSALMSAAIAQVSGSVGSALSGTLVDEVDWDPTSGIRVGKAINDRLFLTYDWNNNADENENRNQVTLEWLITRRAFAEFVTGDATESSAEIYWRVLFGEHLSEEETPPAAPPAPETE